MRTHANKTNANFFEFKNEKYLYLLGMKNLFLNLFLHDCSLETAFKKIKYHF